MDGRVTAVTISNYIRISLMISLGLICLLFVHELIWRKSSESKFELSIHSLKKYKNWWIVHSQAPLFEHILNGVLSSIERAIPHIRIHLIHFVREEAPARDVFCRWILIPNEVIWTKETTIWLHLTTIIKHTSYRHSCWDSRRI